MKAVDVYVAAMIKPFDTVIGRPDDHQLGVWAETAQRLAKAVCEVSDHDSIRVNRFASRGYEGPGPDAFDTYCARCGKLALEGVWVDP